MADGYTVYQGVAADSLKYFESHMSAKAGRFANPADIYMKELSLSYPMTDDDHMKIQKLTMIYNREQKDVVEREMREVSVPTLTGEKKRKVASFSEQWT